MSVPVAGGAPNSNTYEVDENAFQHVILVDEDLNIISSEDDKGDTAYVFAIQKLTPSLELAAGQNLTLETTLTGKARAPLGCPGDLASPCAFNTPLRTLSIGLVVD